MPAETDVEQGPLERPEVLQLVRDRLADILEIDPSSISEGASFTNDLGADSPASPAVADGRMFLKGRKMLFCVGAK